MRLAAFLEYALIIFGAIGIVAARYFALPKGMHLGIFVIGAGVLIGALESFTRGVSGCVCRIIARMAHTTARQR